MPNRPGFLLPRIDWGLVMAAPRTEGGHEEVLDALFGVHAEVLFRYHSGGIRGTVGRVYLFSDCIVVLSDYYGSCSGCDAWEGVDDGTARRLVRSMVNSAYIARFPAELLAFFDGVRGDSAGTYYRFFDMVNALYDEVKEWVESGPPNSLTRGDVTTSEGPSFGPVFPVTQRE